MVRKKSELYYNNLSKYLKQPEWWQVEEFIKELGITMAQFERFYGLPYNTLVQVKSGHKRLSPEYWHFIYERIKPAYGAGFVVDYSANPNKKRIKHYLPEKLPTDSHNRLDEIQ